MLALLEAAGVGAIVRGPLAQGLLAGRPAAPYLDRTEREVRAAAAALAAVGERKGGTVAAALRFVLDVPAVAAVVPGASTPAQVSA